MSRKHFKRMVNRQYEKKTWFNGYVYDFSVHYNATDVDNIVDIHKYLVQKITV